MTLPYFPNSAFIDHTGGNFINQIWHNSKVISSFKGTLQQGRKHRKHEEQGEEQNNRNK